MRYVEVPDVSICSHIVISAAYKTQRDKDVKKKDARKRFEVPCVGQVIKGLRWMPWDQEPMKGAARLR